MIVLAAPGINVPQEEKPRDYITETPPAGMAGYSVPDSAYYLRRVADGDLVVVCVPGGVAADAIVPATKAKKGAE